MFKKCLKYDLRAPRKVWLIAAAVMVLLSILGGVGGFLYSNGILNLTTTPTQDTLTPIQILSLISMMIGMFSLIAVVYAIAIFTSGTGIMLYIRYYVHFFTDQGYLTFTLPVKRSTHFWSKAVSGMIYMLCASAISSFTILCLLCGFFTPMLLNSELAQKAGFDFSALMGETGAAGIVNVLYVLVLLVLFFLLITAVQFTSLMTQYLIITLAATLFRSHKLLGVILAYVGFGALTMAVYFVGYFFVIIYVMLLTMFLVMGLMELFTISILGWLAIYALMLVACAAFITVGLTLANFTVNRLERKLNLA